MHWASAPVLVRVVFFNISSLIFPSRLIPLTFLRHSLVRVWVDFPGWTKLILGELAGLGLPKVKIYGEFVLENNAFIDSGSITTYILFND